MKRKQNHKLTTGLFTVLFFAMMWMILQEMNGFFVPNEMIGIQTASAAAQYGILGRTAPELMLNTWIDGNGKQIAPIRLNDCRGKIVYLYFFQNW